MQFDIEKALKESGISPEDASRIKQYCRKEFGDDEMMYELHVIRTIKAFKEGNFPPDHTRQQAAIAREARKSYSGSKKKTNE